MEFLQSFDNHLEDLLHRLCVSLQITATQRDLAESRYKSVTEWLAADESTFWGKDLNIYPQGSFRIGTTVKPLAHQEFDLDLVCEINRSWQGKNPLELLNAMEQRLRLHKTYNPMVQRKNRCIRLNYVNEFHMDLLPACPSDSNGSGCLKVPDREAKDWKDSNPSGYAEWFDDRAKQYETFLEKRASIHPLPNEEPVEFKPPLKKAVQLIKRQRDIYFLDNPNNAPISIVLTTLAGTIYNNQDSVYQTIESVLSGIISLIPDRGRLIVLNPTNKKEDLSERWDSEPLLYGMFKRYIKDFLKQWQQLKYARGTELNALIKSLFGEKVTNAVLLEQAMAIEEARKSSKLRSSWGLGSLTVLKTNSTPVRRNTFYGED